MSLNSIMGAAGMSCNGMCYDAEYVRIIRALRAYGIEPTGDKQVDKTKLHKIEAAKDSQNAQFSNTNDHKQKAESTEENNNLTDKNEGANQLALLNKIKLGLL